MASGLTFDTGALIAFENRRQRVRKLVDAALRDGLLITVPTAVVVEWWRGGAGARTQELILRSMRVERLEEHIAKLAGEAIAHVAGTTPVDAIVMASAALRGDVVYTSDIGDLDRLKAFFPNVRVLSA